MYSENPRYQRRQEFEALMTLKEHYEQRPYADLPDPHGDKGWNPSTADMAVGFTPPTEEQLPEHDEITSDGWIHGDPEFYEDGA